MLKKISLPLLILFSSWLIFFSRTLFFGQVYFLDDLKIIYYPLEHVYAQFQANWSLPVWSELFGFGQPLLAWGQLGFFTPVHVLLRFLGLHPLLLLQASILIYFALGLAGMYWFLVKHRLHPLAAALGALVYVFSGFNVGHLNHVNFYVGTMVLPWLLVGTKWFVDKPSLRSTAVLALLAAIIPLSAQPQISLYCLLIAALYGLMCLLIQSTNYKLLTKTVSLTLLAGILSFSLASFSILPLWEFLPQTERASDLPASELYEFSYPPEHLITLFDPYHFGDHESYWGAKNFQELAAYVGFIPMLLALLALFYRPDKKPEQIFGLLLVVIAIVLAPGVHSPIYRFLIENRVITTLSIPGRFILFFDTGLAILAGIGLNKLIRNQLKYFVRFKTVAILIVSLTAANLIFYGWNYNPLTPGQLALAPSPLTAHLENYRLETGLPPRLHAAETLPLAGIIAGSFKPTEVISPTFQIHQPFTLWADTQCLQFPVHTEVGAATGAVDLTLSEAIGATPIFSATLPVDQIDNDRKFRFCLPADAVRHMPRQLFFSVTSDHLSHIKFFYQPQTEPSIYFVRVPNPSAQQIAQSQKNGHLLLEQELSTTVDQDKALLMRHIQATANASSSRWIGALSIAPFRAFIEDFFANDRDPINGEGVHALVHNRSLVDMSGITHLAQAVALDTETDAVMAQGYELITEQELGTQQIRLYRNPNSFPRAFLVADAIFEPDANHVRHLLSQPNYNPRQLIYINGPRPPVTLPAPKGEPASGAATIIKYSPTHISIDVTTDRAAWLVLTDNHSEQWQTYLDDQLQPQFLANTTWRTVLIPPGHHTVSFRYTSPATILAKKLTYFALFIVILISMTSSIYQLIRKRLLAYTQP